MLGRFKAECMRIAIFNEWNWSVCGKCLLNSAALI
jgi:hypothetical protein